MARLRNEEMPTVSVDLHDIFDVNPSQLPDSDYLNGKFRAIVGWYVLPKQIVFVLYKNFV